MSIISYFFHTQYIFLLSKDGKEICSSTWVMKEKVPNGLPDFTACVVHLPAWGAGLTESSFKDEESVLRCSSEGAFTDPHSLRWSISSVRRHRDDIVMGSVTLKCGEPLILKTDTSNQRQSTRVSYGLPFMLFSACYYRAELVECVKVTK